MGAAFSHFEPIGSLMSFTPAEGQPAPQPPAQQATGQNPYLPQPYPSTVVFAPTPPRGLSITAMVLGIVGIVGFAAGGGILSVGAVIFGHIGLRKEPAGRGMAIAGIVTGYVGILCSVLVVVFLVLVPLFFLFLAAGVSAGTTGLSS